MSASLFQDSSSGSKRPNYSFDFRYRTMARKTIPLSMSIDQRKLLESWVRAKTIPQRVFFRARICLLAADGLTNSAIARELNTCRPTVCLWKKRFENQGPGGLVKDAPRGPSSKRTCREKVRSIMEATFFKTPPNGDRWTTRSLAKAEGVSNATIARIWKANGFKPKQKGNFIERIHVFFGHALPGGKPKGLKAACLAKKSSGRRTNS